MGIPKAYRFFSERWPLLNQPVKTRLQGEVDNL